MSEGESFQENSSRNSEFGVILNKENGFFTSSGVCPLAEPTARLPLPD